MDRLEKILGRFYSRKLAVTIVAVWTTLSANVKADLKAALVTLAGAIYVAVQGNIDGKQ